MKPRVIIGGHEPVFVHGLACAAAEVETVELHEVTTDLGRLRSLCRVTAFCIALIDPAISGENAAGLLAELRDAAPTLQIMVISACQAVHMVRQAIEQGASAYLPKTSSFEAITLAIRTVADGRRYFPLLACDRAADSGWLGHLTRRESAVLQLLADGMSNKAIATELDVGVGTVKGYVSALLGKLGATSRVQAVLTAHRLGLIRLP